MGWGGATVVQLTADRHSDSPGAEHRHEPSGDSSAAGLAAEAAEDRKVTPEQPVRAADVRWLVAAGYVDVRDAGQESGPPSGR